MDVAPRSHNCKDALMSDTLINRIPPLVKNFGFGMFCLGATLALGVTVGSQSLGKAIAAINKREAPISVKGLSEVAAKSDRAQWSAVVTARADTMASAFPIIEQHSAQVREFILSHGFTPDEITLHEVNSSFRYVLTDKGTATNKIESCVLTQTISVRTPRVDAVRTLAFGVTALIKGGMEVDSRSPEYSISGLEALKMTLLEKATQNGYERATLLARGSKAGVGQLLSASQGVFQIVPLGSTEVSDWGEYDTSSIDKTVKAVVSLSYAIDS